MVGVFGIVDFCFDGDFGYFRYREIHFHGVFDVRGGFEAIIDMGVGCDVHHLCG